MESADEQPVIAPYPVRVDLYPVDDKEGTVALWSTEYDGPEQTASGVLRFPDPGVIFWFRVRMSDGTVREHHPFEGPPASAADTPIFGQDESVRRALKLLRRRKRRKYGKRYRRFERLAHKLPPDRLPRWCRQRRADLGVLHFDLPPTRPGEVPPFLHQPAPYGSTDPTAIRRAVGDRPIYFDPDGNPLDAMGDAQAMMQYAQLRERHTRVAATIRYRNGVALDISTVYLGLDHSHLGTLPIIYETMIFHDGSAEEQWRYATRGAARHGHNVILAELRADRQRREAGRRKGPATVPPLKVSYAGRRGW